MARKHNVEKTEEDVKALVKISKKTKGMVNIDVLKRILPLMGWSIEDATVVLDASKKSYDIARILEADLWPDHGDREHRVRVVYDGEVPKAWAFAAEKGEDALQLKQIVQEYFTFVTAAPAAPVPGTFYATAPGEIKADKYWTIFSIKKIWLGMPGWIVTTPKGDSVAIPAPLRGRSAAPAPGPAYEIPTFWTFAYKHGIDKDAAAATTAEEVEEAGRTKAERQRIEMQRSALPEIAAVFREITNDRYQSVVKYVEDALRRGTDRVLNVKDDTRIEWHLIPFGPSIQSLMKHKFDYDTRMYSWELKDDYEERVVKEAIKIADEARESFVIKNTARISELAKRKGSTPQAKLLSIGDGSYGGYGGEILFSFPDTSSFILRNKTVWKTSPMGVVFAQFPTTFHDVMLPDGKKMASPSEARMLDVFAAASRATNPSPRFNRTRALAERLSRGE